MSHPADPHSVSRSGRRALRSAVWQSVAALGVTAGLVAAVNAGARLLGPALILVGSLSGAKALRDWWRYLDEEWFVAELALVCTAWAMLAGAFAAVQYFAFSFAPDAFYVEVDYAKLISPRYRTIWERDSSRAAAALVNLERATELLSAGAPSWLAVDTVYALGGGASGQIAERCEARLPLDRCEWQLIVTPAPGARPIEVAIAAPEEDRQQLAGAELQGQLRTETARLRGDVAEYGRRLADPAAFVQPRIVDFLYETTIAFSGRDAGVFAPISALARLFKVFESLASFVLFGIIVSRVSVAGGAKIAGR